MLLSRIGLLTGLAMSPPLPNATLLPPTAAGVTRAAALLNQGKLVIVPTETVYGIALNLAAESARNAARLVKTRAAEGPAPPQFSPWVIHVAQPENLLAWVPHISFLGKRLATKSLPGPVAFDIKLDPADEAVARAGLGPAADETLHENSPYHPLPRISHHSGPARASLCARCSYRCRQRHPTRRH